MSESMETARSQRPESATSGTAPSAGEGRGAAEHDHHEHEQYPFLAHHFDTPKHQFESGKFGIWIFLVTEVLFFAGLFCAYSVYRGMHPEIFYWAHFYLDTNLGAVNTIVLIVSSFTAAWAVRNAQLGQQKLLVGNIVVTILCAFTFMSVKYVEYSHKFHDGLLWGGRSTAEGQPPRFRFDPHHPVWELEEFEHKHPAAAAAARRLYAQAHPETEGHGEHSGTSHDAPATAASASAAESSAPPPATSADVEGAAPSASAAAPGASAAMAQDLAPTEATPARNGENPSAGPLPTTDLAAAPSAATPPEATPEAVAAKDIADTTKAVAAREAPTAGEATSNQEGQAEGSADGDRDTVEVTPEEATAALSALAEMAAADAKKAAPENPLRELSEDEVLPLLRAGVVGPRAVTPEVPSHPKNAHIFFGIYFFMTGLHGLHVTGGIVVWIWLLRRALRGEFGPQYFGPIDYAALYWHLVDLVWIYLFPLLYLIH